MKSAVIDGPVTEKRRRNLVRLKNCETVTCPGGLKYAGSDDPAGSHQPHFGSEQVHAAAPAPRTACLPTVKFRDQLLRRDAFRQCVTMSPMRAEDRVFFVQMGA